MKAPVALPVFCGRRWAAGRGARERPPMAVKRGGPGRGRRGRELSGIVERAGLVPSFARARDVSARRFFADFCADVFWGAPSELLVNGGRHAQPKTKDYIDRSWR